jgi:predicted nucleic-acid-binding protein
VISIDTNVLVRLVAADDAEQAARARALFAAEHVFVAKTVLLETEWVLRSRYDGDQATIHDAFTRLFGLSNVSIEDRDAVLRALALYADGVDFADALHLVSSVRSAEFVTFDVKLTKRAARLRTHPRVRAL